MPYTRFSRSSALASENRCRTSPDMRGPKHCYLRSEPQACDIAGEPIYRARSDLPRCRHSRDRGVQSFRRRSTDLVTGEGRPDRPPGTRQLWVGRTMINIMHALFPSGTRRGNPRPAMKDVPLSAFLSLAWIGLFLSAQAEMGPPFSTVADGPRPSAPVAGFTFSCDRRGGCERPPLPGPPDRDVHPFEGTLGRPCAYRWRPTPSGTRRVRVCF